MYFTILHLWISSFHVHHMTEKYQTPTSASKLMVYLNTGYADTILKKIHVIKSVLCDCTMLLISVWYYQNRLGAVMTVCSPRGCNDSVLASTVVDHGKDHRSGNTKDYKHIVVYRVPAKHATWRGQNNISGWSDMSACELLFQELALIKSNSTCWCSIKLGRINK